MLSTGFGRQETGFKSKFISARGAFVVCSIIICVRSSIISTLQFYDQSKNPFSFLYGQGRADCIIIMVFQHGWGEKMVLLNYVSHQLVGRGH